MNREHPVPNGSSRTAERLDLHDMLADAHIRLDERERADAIEIHVPSFEGDIRRQSRLTIDQCAKPNRPSWLIDLGADGDLEVIALLRSDARAQPRQRTAHTCSRAFSGAASGGATRHKVARSSGASFFLAMDET